MSFCYIVKVYYNITKKNHIFVCLLFFNMIMIHTNNKIKHILGQNNAPLLGTTLTG
jgi:hypothetical protein